MGVPQWQWKTVMFVTVFLSCVSFAIVMPSLWPYLELLGANKDFLAWVVAMYSVGEAAGAVLLGALSSRYSTRTVMVLSAIVGALGSVFYAAAVAMPGPTDGAYLVLFGRILQGVCTGGSQAVQQSHLGKVLPPAELTSTTVALNAYASLGFVFGPFFGLLSSTVPRFRLPSGPLHLYFDDLTGPGYFVLLFTIVNITLYVLFFGSDEEHYATSLPGESDPLLNGTSTSRDTQNGRTKLAAAPHSRLLPALIVCNVAFFVHFYGFALQETITTPLVQAYYRWRVFDANVLFTLGGVASLLAFVGLGIASRSVTEYSLTAWSLALGVGGFALLLSTPEKPLSVTRFIIGFLTISVAFPMGRATVMALYTNLLPLPWQGIGQGVILAVGAIARIVGPFWAVRTFSYRLGGLIVFGATAAIFACTLGTFLASKPSFDGSLAVRSHKAAAREPSV